MKTLIPTYFLIAAGFFSCGSDDDDVLKGPKGAPVWTQGYPQIAHGAVSVDLNVQNDKTSKVYYIIANKALTLSASEVMKYAVKPNTSNIKFSGVIEAPSGQETRKTITGLSEHTTYHTYLVAQNKSDTLFQFDVQGGKFTTYYRQDTSEFTSLAEDRKVKYLIYRPEEALKYPDKQYPMCYFIAGNGEVASPDKPINMIRNGSLPEYIYKGNNVDMMVMSIQHTKKDWNVSVIDEGIEHGNTTYPVNQKKVYLTGMSGGAFGVWNYAVAHPEKLAAIVPISGGGNKGKACMLKDLPVWAFHNQTDNSVASSNTTTMINAIKACPPSKEIKQLMFPDKGHDCWRRVYDKKHANWSKSPSVEKFDIYQWMLSKSK
ncbi:MAG TPA: hypothetical protein VD884_15700 [Ohtaekwangia sp.]|nr:hypothetical protein [Ohtaekwangia sp.]